jgi:hypothetical protein
MRAFTDELKFSYKKKEGFCVELTKTNRESAPEDNTPDD